MLLDVETLAAEEVNVSMVEVAAEDVDEEADEVEEETADEVVEGSAAHMKMVLTYYISPVTLKIHNGLHSKTRQGK